MMTNAEIVQIVGAITYKTGWRIDVMLAPAGRSYLQITALTEDSHKRDGAVTTWRSGKRYLSPHMCRQEIVGACFALFKDAEDHELREWFRYRGAAIFNPHLDPDVLVEVARKASSFCVREDAMGMSEPPGPPLA